ncbi:GH32 C-terminal domain-containing protein [Paenibacillus sp. Soil787]|uniref:GH32 C-terminal domain-containing protein n=1 Tax=Paenibacillus sp. Soil787 TaxID=1736411 RepID=UPI001910CABE|nr:GH32 C-terminal domain-containing protein [Paenibacillus sp. Soil787]
MNIIICIKPDTCCCRPIQELSRLRGGVTAYENVKVSGETSLDGIAGDCYEMEVWMDMTEAVSAGIKLRVNEAKDEQTVLNFKRDENAVTLDRNKSGKGPGGVRKAPVELVNGILQLRIFVDRSSVEVFLQDGAKVMTARIYPGETSTGICFFAEGNVKIIRLYKWDLKKVWE